MSADLEEMKKDYAFWSALAGPKGFIEKHIPDLVYILISFCKNLILYIRDAHVKTAVNQKQYDLIYIALTVNQARAIHGWSDKIEIDSQAVFGNVINFDIHVPVGEIAKKALFLTWSTYKLIVSEKKHKCEIKYIDQFIRYRAMKIIFSKVIERNKPKIVVLSNDHSGESRAIIRLCQRYNIKTIYTQHAPVGKIFPTLEFDVSLLDGLQAIDAYSKNIPLGNVVVTGRVRNSLELNFNINKSYIAVALNELDSILCWIRLLIKIKKDNRIKLRPHPADKRKFIWKIVCRLIGLEYSDVSLHKFINESKLLISGLSGIILDASVAGVPCIMYLPKKLYLKYGDYYLYEKYELCRIFYTYEEVMEKLIASCQVAPKKSTLSFDAGFIMDPDICKAYVVNRYIGSLINNEKFKLEEGWVLQRQFGIQFWAHKNYLQSIYE